MSGFFSYGGGAASESLAAAPAAGARSILGELDNDDWERFIGFAARRRYPAGALVIERGDTGRALCFIASGQVEIHTADGAHSRRGEGEVFGLLSFLDGAPSASRVSVSAAGPAELLLLSPEALQQLAAWQPRIALALLRDLGAHVAARLRTLQGGD